MDFSARKKSIIFYLTSFFLSICFLAAAPALSSNVLAQNNNSSQYNTPNFNPEVPRNQHTFAQSAMIETISSVFCLITGIDPIVPTQGCLDIDPKTHKLGLRPPQDGKPQLGGLMGFLPGMFSMVYTPPASGTDYVRYLAGNFGITKPVYAQTGGGFEALRPLLPLWTAARNVAYLLFVLVFIIIGLAIMLRVKIDPRTVMTLQNQIPRIIIGILLVTFSYAIAALMVDGMWLLTYTGINAITQADPAVTNPATTGCTPDLRLQQRASQNLLSTPFTYSDQVLRQVCTLLGGSGLAQVAWNVSQAIADIVGNLIDGLFTGFAVGDCIVLWAIPPVVNLPNCIGGALGNIVGFIAGILALIIVVFALTWALITLWFELLKAYVMLILYIIAAPLWIVTGLLPGNPLGFGKWLRRVFVHLAVFPAVACLLVIAAILMNIFQNAGPGSFVPPMVGQPNMTGFGSLLAFAVILMAPSLLEVLKENLHATSKGGQIAGGMVIGNIASGAAPVKGLGGGVWGLATNRGAMGEASYATNYVAGWGKKLFKSEKWQNRWENTAHTLGGTSKESKGPNEPKTWKTK